jgi:hypothetical protein
MLPGPFPFCGWLASARSNGRALRSVADRLLSVGCAVLKTGTTFAPTLTAPNAADKRWGARPVLFGRLMDARCGTREEERRVTKRGPRATAPIGVAFVRYAALRSPTGIAPVTEKSAKSCVVVRRQACHDQQCPGPGAREQGPHLCDDTLVVGRAAADAASTAAIKSSSTM